MEGPDNNQPLILSQPFQQKNLCWYRLYRFERASWASLCYYVMCAASVTSHTTESYLQKQPLSLTVILLILIISQQKDTIPLSTHLLLIAPHNLTPGKYRSLIRPSIACGAEKSLKFQVFYLKFQRNLEISKNKEFLKFQRILWKN